MKTGSVLTLTGSCLALGLLLGPGTGQAETYRYDTAGRLVEVDYGGGVKLTYAYDPNGNLLLRAVATGGPASFHRGDPNHDGRIDLSDGISIFNFLFLGGPGPTCREAADANNDGGVNITDGIFILNYLFVGGPTPPPPGPPGEPCGPDPDPQGGARDLGCDLYDKC